MTYLHDIHPDATIIDAPFTGHNGSGVDGYGGKIKTSFKVKINKRLHRLYCMCWSNSGTLWVNIGGNQIIVHEHRHKRE